MSSLVVNPGLLPGRAPASSAERLTSITVQPLPGEDWRALCRRFAERLRESEATPVHLQVFGDRRAAADVTGALQNFLGRGDWPVTWVEGNDCSGQPVAGLQVHAFTGEVEPLLAAGRVVGSVFTDGGARQCVVGGLLPDPALSRPEQTAQALENLQAALETAGFALGDVVRTWFFLEHILDWYGDFNRARTRIYSGVKFRTGSLPASTGVGAGNPAGAALALAAWAFRPLEKNAAAEEVASPLQCPAPAYGSSFSRAMETTTNGGRRLFISGTASIAPGGASFWADDVYKQVELTMAVVEAILSSRGFGFADLVRAAAYFRHPKDVGAFAKWLRAYEIPPLPVVTAQCDVCRDDLLFELEAEAVSAAPG